MMSFKKITATTLLVLLGAGFAQAQDLGKEEYMNSCATCHGEMGKGAGPLAELMTVPVPSLTNLSAQNDGVFPMLRVIHTIDGRPGIKGHGYPMPVWGKRFEADVEDAGPYGSETLIRGRILSLALYLESIQE
ncbi:c-type cytochrome [uncultured Roseovarius sp.]|uniref:c-type cytochrome n=1 Tax=uncultured Roseovarius sp. TaxID=293344 RepID=UPI0025D6946B|nr:c-type cytochrome [uncultured Roseovarius sp.]